MQQVYLRICRELVYRWPTFNCAILPVKIKTILSVLLWLSCSYAVGQEYGDGARKFAQLETALATPNVYRTASGAPGKQYWQQQVDYKIKVRLDENKRRIFGEELITYTNNSPDTLRYLWVQLDQNRFKKESIDQRTRTASKDRLSYRRLQHHFSGDDTAYGYKLTAVTDAREKDIPYTINDTMMRLDLATPLKPGKTTELAISWEFNVLEQIAMKSRGGFEHFPDSDTYIYFLAQWFPRMAAYTDYAGWQHKQFLGRGEFTLEFGNYDVEITVPDDHIVSSTGMLTNPSDVLTGEQRRRLASANTDEQVFIITADEAKENEKFGTDKQKTWHFRADNVRDFAWSSSRKFIWDAMLHEQPGAKHDKVLAMSFYPNEAEPIWSHYSTHAVVHTMEVYSRFSFDYPYPTAQSVNTWKFGGMEYPMITFNGYRPTLKQPEDEDEDESSNEQSLTQLDSNADTSNLEPESDQDVKPTYSRSIKYGLIGVIIHEVGHIYFPMVVNSDERQWTWMDEGLNSFLEYLAELEWEEQFPAYSENTNVLDYIPTYMTSKNQVPIMTNSESILQFGPNAYNKPTAALAVLRELVMGRELFDFAFKEYAQRWKFKRPTPADFFRTMEDASGVDLDWFWRGWFYTTDHVDISISSIREYRILTNNPDIDNALLREDWSAEHPAVISETLNRAEGKKLRIDRYPELKDIYNKNDRFIVTNKDRNDYKSAIKKLEDWQLAVLDRAIEEDKWIYFVDFENLGGLISPLPLQINYEDGSTGFELIPAEIWRKDASSVTRLFIESKPLSSIELDNQHTTGDADYANNQYPPVIRKSRLELYKSDRKRRDLMADLLVELKSDSKTEPAVKDVLLEPTQ